MHSSMFHANSAALRGKEHIEWRFGLWSVAVLVMIRASSNFGPYAGFSGNYRPFLPNALPYFGDGPSEARAALKQESSLFPQLSNRIRDFF